jgi:bacteriorhodopsin
MQVILIHLSNLTGLNGEYSRRTMFLLVSDLGTIVWGVSAANAKGAAKAIFFCVGLCYGCNTFYNAARVYIESYHTVPKGICRKLVMLLAWMFFVAWSMFPLAFIAGVPLFHSFSIQLALQRPHTREASFL